MTDRSLRRSPRSYSGERLRTEVPGMGHERGIYAPGIRAVNVAFTNNWLGDGYEIPAYPWDRISLETESVPGCDCGKAP